MTKHPNIPLLSLYIPSLKLLPSSRKPIPRSPPVREVEAASNPLAGSRRLTRTPAQLIFHRAISRPIRKSRSRVRGILEERHDPTLRLLIYAARVLQGIRRYRLNSEGRVSRQCCLKLKQGCGFRGCWARREESTLTMPVCIDQGDQLRHVRETSQTTKTSTVTSMTRRIPTRGTGTTMCSGQKTENETAGETDLRARWSGTRSEVRERDSPFDRRLSSVSDQKDEVL